MASKSITTKSGNTIVVELERRVQDKVSYADGYNIVVGREIVERTKIKFLDRNGKLVAEGNEVQKLYPKISRMDAQAMEQGAVGKVGTGAYVRQEVLDQINAALAELDAENPKSDEQLAIEAAKAEAHARWEAELPAMMEAEAFARRMDDPNSDL